MDPHRTVTHEADAGVAALGDHAVADEHRLPDPPIDLGAFPRSEGQSEKGRRARGPDLADVVFDDTDPAAVVLFLAQTLEHLLSAVAMRLEPAARLAHGVAVLDAVERNHYLQKNLFHR